MVGMVGVGFGLKHFVKAVDSSAVFGCPFGLASALPIYCDESLRPFAVVIPAAGATNAALRIEPDRMAEITEAQWVNVCR